MDGDLDLGAVLPYVKPIVDRRDDGMPSLGADVRPITRQFVGSLVTTYLLDEGYAFRYVSEDLAAKVGQNADELHRHAVENLARRVSELTLRTPKYHAITPVLFDGNLEVSIMFLDDLWARFESEFGESEILAVAPCRDILAFCPARSAEGRTQLGEVIERVWEGADHRLTKDFYRRVEGTWRLERVYEV